MMFVTIILRKTVGEDNRKTEMFVLLSGIKGVLRLNF